MVNERSELRFPWMRYRWLHKRGCFHCQHCSHAKREETLYPWIMSPWFCSLSLPSDRLECCGDGFLDSGWGLGRVHLETWSVYSAGQKRSRLELISERRCLKCNGHYDNVWILMMDETSTWWKATSTANIWKK